MGVSKQDTSTREDLGMLAVLEALTVDQKVTQRELSRQTGLNLKKVNFCLHKLLERGHVKFQRALHNPDKRGYLYILTPTGLKEKSRLTYRFLKLTLAYYNQVEEKLKGRLAEMGKAGVQRVVLYGASDAVGVVLSLVAGNGIEVVGVLDEGYPEERLDGVPVVDGTGLQSLEWDGMLVTSLDDADGADSMVAEMGLPADKVWRL